MQISIVIDDKLVDDAIRHARISYWARKHQEDDRFYVLDWCADARIEHHRDDWHEFTPERIRSGVETMAQRAPRQFAHLAGGRSDEVTGDLLVQYICFGEVLYG